MAATRHFILATAGHVDHGKSALVKALTGTDPDRLPEEKARGITIDLGFAHLELGVPETALGGDTPGRTAPSRLTPPRISVGMVDVPGHEDFVKNMVAGVGSIDVAMLVVAADDGWMPQTEEHLQILSYLGVARAVGVLTKTDLAPGGIDPAIAAVRRHLEHSPFAQAPIVATSVVTGEGLAELRATLAGVLEVASDPVDQGRPRLPVDRVFTLHGIGTVVTGTLIGGTLERGQAVVIEPADTPARIRTLQVHNREVERARPGTRVALNLADVEPRRPAGPGGIGRGDVVTLEGVGQATDTLDVVLGKSGRLAGLTVAAARPLADDTRVAVHYGSAHVLARVRLREAAELRPGEQALAQLRCEQPVFLLTGDRCILRDSAEQATLAGGRVLDVEAARKGWRRPEQLELLRRRQEAPDDLRVFLLSRLNRDGMVPQRELSRGCRFSTLALEAALVELAREGVVVGAGDAVVLGSVWQRLKQRALEQIDEAHRLHPERPGISLSELRSALAADLKVAGVFEGLVEGLCSAGVRRAGNALQRAGHRSSLPPALRAAGERIRAALNARPVDPPARPGLAPDAPAQQALRFLIEAGEAVAVAPELVLGAEAYRSLVGLIRGYLREHGQATVSELRQAAGCTRRVMVPLLEKLDREGITRRQGDVRRLVSGGA